MDTISVSANVIGCEPVEFESDGIVIPVVVGFSRDGSVVTAADLAARARVDPAKCDHAGASWSSNLAMRCQKCGSPMFLPPRLLAYLPAVTIAAMDVLWSAAGWPEWRGEAWHINEHWTLHQHPLFDHVGGIPVGKGYEDRFADAVQELAA